MRRPTSLSAVCRLSFAGSLAFIPHALANRYSDRGGIAAAAGRYSVVFGAAGATTAGWTDAPSAVFTGANFT